MIIDEPKHYQKPATLLIAIYILFKHFIAVAGLIGINNTWLRDKGALGSSVDLNTILTPGVYRISSNSLISYKMMVVFKGDSYTVQLFFGIGANDKSLRMRNYYNGEWSTMHTIFQ